MKPTTAELCAVLMEHATREYRRAREMYKRADAEECTRHAHALEEAAARLERGEGTCRWRFEVGHWHTSCGWELPTIGEGSSWAGKWGDPCPNCRRPIEEGYAPEPPAAPDPGRRKTLDEAFDEPKRYGDGSNNTFAPAPSAPPEEPGPTPPARYTTIGRAHVAAATGEWCEWQAVETWLAYADTLRESLRLAREERDRAFREGESKQAILEVQSRERFLTSKRAEWDALKAEAVALRARCGRLESALGDAIEAIEVCSNALEPHWGSNARRDARHAADAARAALEVQP